MQCQNDWRNSVAILQDHAAKNIELKNTPEIQGHIESLIECVESLFKERTQLRSEWEENTIKAGSLQRKHNELEKERSKEWIAAVSAAKEQNDESIQEVKQITEDIQTEMDQAIQKARQLNYENKSLEVKAEEAKLMWPQLSAMMDTTMQKKVELQIKVNETRCKTVESHQRAVALFGECEEIELDIENYWKYCCVQANKIKSAADIWKAEILKQDVKTNEAKVEMDDLQEETRWSQTRNLKANMEKKAEEEKLAQLEKKTEGFKQQVRLKLNEKGEIETEIKNKQLQLSWFRDDYEQHIKELEDNDAKTREECMETYKFGKTLEIKKLMVTERLTEVSLDQDKKEEKKRKRRNELMEITSMMNMVVADEATARAARMKYKKSLITVGETRDQMERMFSLQLNKLNKTVEKERKLRKKHLSHWEDSVTVLKHWNKVTKEYFEKSENDIKKSLQLKDDYKNEYDELMKKIAELDIQEAELRLKITKKQKKLGIMTKNFIRKIDVINKSIETKTTENEILLQAKIALDLEYDRILNQFYKYSSRYESFVEKLMDLNRQQKNIILETKNCKQKLQHLILPQIRMKNELDEINHEAIEQLKRFKAELEAIGIKIAKLIGLNDEIELKNFVFKKECNEITLNLGGIDIRQHLHRNITSKFVDLSQWRRHHLYLIKMEQDLADEFTLKTQQDQGKIVFVKFCVNQRKLKLENLTSEFKTLILNFTDFLSSANKIEK